MDNNAPTAAAPVGETVATPNTNMETTAAPQTPDMHGFTSEDLAGMRTFIDNNGGWDKIKSRISNPQPVQPMEQQSQQIESQPQNQAVQPQAQTPQQPAYKAPEGSITAQEFLAQQYFQALSSDPKYSSISAGIANGDYLKEMAAFGINALNRDGSINDQKVRMYLDLKAQTVPAKPTGTEPDASNAPIKTYTEVGDSGFSNIEQAYKVLLEPGNPNMAKAEEYIRNAYNPDLQKKDK